MSKNIWQPVLCIATLVLAFAAPANADVVKAADIDWLEISGGEFGWWDTAGYSELDNGYWKDFVTSANFSDQRGNGLKYKGEDLNAPYYEEGSGSLEGTPMPSVNFSLRDGASFGIGYKTVLTNVELRSGAFFGLGGDGDPAFVTNMFVGEGASFSVNNFVGSSDNPNSGGYIKNLSFTDADGGHGTLNVTLREDGKFNMKDGVQISLADNIDLTGGNIVVNMMVLGTVGMGSEGLYANGFDLADLFGESKLSGVDAIGNLEFQFSDDDVLNLVADGALATGWSLSGTVLSYAAPTDGNAAPEPATLALFGLGLGGLAAARRRKK